jgi:hypothetical protein
MARFAAASFLALGLSGSAHAASVAVTFTKLTGVTGGNPAGTAVYRADLTGLGLTSIQSITIKDASSSSDGSPGKFSGFDLDAIKLAYSNTFNVPTSASGASSLTGLTGFDFSTSGTMFTPGSQTPPPDNKLFGTGPTGTTVDNSVATLGLFDANSTTGDTADGFISLGVGGQIAFNLTSAISTTGSNGKHLYLYIGEVGDNGEVASGTIMVSDTHVPTVPEPSSFAMIGIASLVGLGVRRRRSA